MWTCWDFLMPLTYSRLRAYPLPPVHDEEYDLSARIKEGGHKEILNNPQSMWTRAREGHGDYNFLPWMDWRRAIPQYGGICDS